MGNDNDAASVAGTTDDQEPGPGVTPAKRRRIALACSACRIRKSRCNGVRPKCEPCQRLGFECCYELPETSANLLVPRDIFSTLEDRVRTLEARIRDHDNRLVNVENSQARDAGPDMGARQEGPGSVVVNIDGIQDPPTDHSMTDGMAISFVDEQDCGFFGPSSNIAFMRHIFRAMTRSTGVVRDRLSPASASNMGFHEAGMISVSRPSSPNSVSWRQGSQGDAVGANLLPPHTEMLKLIQAYFSNTGLLFPFIHEESFLATYESMRSRNFRTNVRRTWLGLLNMVLAMAVSTSSWSEGATQERTEQSDIYYRRARKLLKRQMLRGTTLETVQYLLLTSQYLQGTQQSVQTWTTHGLAVKAALSIGLHSTDAMGKFSPIEQEMRKRTWFGCVILDRSLSMTFGRPSTIPEDYIKTDLPRSMAFLAGVSNPIEEASVAFFNATILLYRLMWKIMATLYGHNLGCDEPLTETSMITLIFQLEQELGDWQSSLPSSLMLRLPSDLAAEQTTADPILERFRLILTLRSLNVQLLLHRPSLTKSLGSYVMDANGSTTQGTSVNQMQRNFNCTCVQVAEDIIDIVHAVLTKQKLGRQLIGAWWFTLYYSEFNQRLEPQFASAAYNIESSTNRIEAFNAALAVFGSLLLPADDIGLDMSPEMKHIGRGKQHLEKAVEALMKLDTHNVILDRCIDYLGQLIELVSSWTSPSSRIAQCNGPPPTALNNEYLPQDITGGATEVSPDLFAGMPPLFESSIPVFDNNLELGQFFAPEFQKWFGRHPA